MHAYRGRVCTSLALETSGHPVCSPSCDHDDDGAKALPDRHLISGQSLFIQAPVSCSWQQETLSVVQQASLSDTRGRAGALGVSTAQRSSLLSCCDTLRQSKAGRTQASAGPFHLPAWEHPVAAAQAQVYPATPAAAGRTRLPGPATAGHTISRISRCSCRCRWCRRQSCKAKQPCIPSTTTAAAGRFDAQACQTPATELDSSARRRHHSH